METTNKETIKGIIDYVRFYDAEQGMAIVKTVAEGHSEPVVIIGHIPQPVKGQPFIASGEWVETSYGLQLKTSSYKVVIPTDPSGITSFIGSGLLKGVGPAIAKRIVEKFGVNTLHIISKDPEQLISVKGVTEAGAEKIHGSWKKYEEMMDLLLFLSANGIPMTKAGAIFRMYGTSSVETLSTNPYLLATDISGIGFVTADRIAKSIGIPANSEFRVSAGIVYLIETNSDSGHTCVERTKTVEETAKILELPDEDRDIVLSSLSDLIRTGKIVEEMVGGVPNLFLPDIYHAETNSARTMKKLLSADVRIVDKTHVDAAEKMFTLKDKQTEALEKALSSPVSIMTGGPGVGKTTTIKAILHCAVRSGISVSLCAPTGRAAQKMSETCSYPASTIHRLLQFVPGGGFQKNDSNPLEADMVIVDEMSMVDIRLFNSLLKSVRVGTRLVLVGDSDQLPSVGPGSVLHDLISSGEIPVTVLNIIQRQAGDSRIVWASHNVRCGRGLFTDVPDTSRNDAHLITIKEPEEAKRNLRDMIMNSAPKDRYDLQVITPMNKGSLGTTEINKLIQELVIPPSDMASGLTVGKRKFCVGDRVMQIRNNYTRGVFNGTIGYVTNIDSEDKSVSVDFDGSIHVYEITDLGDLNHAFAITIHKSQGSEFENVILLLANEHYVMLQRRLVYTAMTRARKKLTIISSAYALSQSIRNVIVEERRTSLREKLQSAATNFT